MKEEVDALNASVEDTEAELEKARDETLDLNHQLAYTAQNNDQLVRENKQLKAQLNALERYVYVMLRPDEST